MNTFKLDKNYWKYYHYQVDVDKLHELRKEEDDKMVMDDSDIHGKGKKKRETYWKRK